MLLNFLGSARIWIHDLQGAEELFLEAEELADIGGFQEILASVEGNLALLEQRRGEVERAIERTRRQLAHYEQLGAFREQARVSNNLGLLLLDLGREVEEAHRLFLASLQLSRTHHYPLIEAQSISCLGMWHMARGAYARALTFFREAETHFRNLHMAYYVLANRLNAALCHMEMGHLSEALQAFETLFTEIHPSRMPGLRLELLVHCTRLRIRAQRFSDARHLLQEIQNLMAAHPELDLHYVLPYLQGLLARSGANWEEAEKAFMEALSLSDRIGDVRVRGDLLIELAETRIQLKKPGVMELLDEAETLFSAYSHAPKLQRIQQLRERKLSDPAQSG